MPNTTDKARPVLPDWQVATWLNTQAPITLQSLRGRVLLLHAFQMLCPGCVAHGLRQAERVRWAFPGPNWPSSACTRCSSTMM